MGTSVYLFVIFSLINYTTSQTSLPTAETKYGQLSGAWKNSTGGRSYASFEGIPYGATTAGEGRFQDPKEPASWSGIRTANTPGSECVQYNSLISDPAGRVIGSEDCLFLNVHSSDLSPSTPLPVMVFIFGGGFLYGGGDLYGAGFLSTEDNIIAGNMGLKDQVLALKWVQDNIHGFGGDPDNVTLTGQSVGAASVHYHILSDLSKGTFQRAIMPSGSAFAPWALQVNPLENARALAEHLGCSTETNEIIADCLRMKPAEEIVQAQDIFFEKDWDQNWFSAFRPSIESSEVEDHFISEHPYLRAKNGKSQKVPLIISATNGEGLALCAAYGESELEDLNSRYDELADYVFIYGDTIPALQQLQVGTTIRSYFLQGETLSNRTFPKLVDALSERAFLVDIGKAAEIHAATTGQPTYMYISLIRQNGLPWVPTAEGIEWQPLSPGSSALNYLNIRNPSDIHMGNSSNFGNRVFWNSLGFMEDENILDRFECSTSSV